METAWEAVQHDLGVTTPFAAYFREIGRPFRDILERLGLADQADEIERVYRATALREAPRVPAFPGIHTALRAARQARREARRRDLEGALADGLDARAVRRRVRDRADAGTALPGQAGAVPAARRRERGAASDVRDSVFVGDMDVDGLAARAAGMRFLHAGWGYGACPDGAEQLRAPRELGEVGLPAPLAA